MARRSQEPRNEEELAEFFDKRKGDMSLWAEEPTSARVRKGGTVVFSIRLTVEELELLREQAAARGVTISDLIRRAALESLQEPLRLSDIRFEWQGTAGQKIVPALGAGTANIASFKTNLPGEQALSGVA